MKTVIRIATTLAFVSAASAAQGNTGEGMSLLTMLFLGFGALILVCQFIPAIALFGSMIYELFAAPRTAKFGSEPQEKSL